MNCKQCGAEFVSNHPRKIYCSRVCKDLIRNEVKKEIRRKYFDAEGMTEKALRLLRRPEFILKNYKIPPIPLKYQFLHGKKPIRITPGFVARQVEMRADAVKAMVCESS